MAARGAIPASQLPQKNTALFSPKVQKKTLSPRLNLIDSEWIVCCLAQPEAQVDLGATCEVSSGQTIWMEGLVRPQG